MARERFRQRLENGEPVGNCSCHDETDPTPADGPQSRVVGVRFRDSARTYFFTADGVELEPGDAVVCPTARGEEAGRVVIAPKQVLLSQIEGQLRPIIRRMTDDDIATLDARRKDAARILRLAGEISRHRGFGLKPVSAEYTLDGRVVRIAYGGTDHTYVEDFNVAMEYELGLRVELAHVGPRDEARLIGGLGKCGRTLCCSSWLPAFPDVSMSMAKNQDLALNPSKVSGLCGRLLCCLSYENEQYRKARQLLPRLGHKVMTEDGEGVVISLQILNELVTVRLNEGDRVETYPAADLIRGGRSSARAAARHDVGPGDSLGADQPVHTPKTASPAADAVESDDRPRRRRRRRGRRSGGNADDHAETTGEH